MFCHGGMVAVFFDECVLCFARQLSTARRPFRILIRVAPRANIAISYAGLSALTLPCVSMSTTEFSASSQVLPTWEKLSLVIRVAQKHPRGKTHQSSQARQNSRFKKMQCDFGNRFECTCSNNQLKQIS